MDSAIVAIHRLCNCNQWWPNANATKLPLPRNLGASDGLDSDTISQSLDGPRHSKWHFAVVREIQLRNVRVPVATLFTSFVYICSMLLLNCFLAFASFHCFEKHFLKLKSKWQTK